MPDYINSVLLIGCGYMGQEYARVLKALNVNFIAVGRGEASARTFAEKTGVQPHVGGLESFFNTEEIIPSRAIVAVGVEELYNVTTLLIRNGVKEILLEKPGAMYYTQINELNRLADDYKCQVWIAYNRRFYASVQTAKKMIAEDGGISSFKFEFTEWAHKVEGSGKPPVVLENWFLCNSTHVIDLAFYLGGIPEKMNSYVSGELSWYPKAGSFSGAGQTREGVNFSYFADWESAGRWGVEILTKKRKLILSPLEELKSQKRGTIIVETVDIDDTLDKQFKPGVYLQTQAFLQEQGSQLLPLREHCAMCEIYQKMENGGH